MSILDYLVAKSKVAKELDSPTLEELLVPYCGPGGLEAILRLSKLLECLPMLETEPLKISNCMLDDTLPYDSLIGLSIEDIKELATLVDYLYLPAVLSEKLQSVLEKGTTGWADLYEPLEFIKNGDIRGIEHICDTLDKFHIDYITFNLGNSLKFVYDSMPVAALHGQLDMLKWLKNRFGCKNYQDSCKNAAAKGHLECLKWLNENNNGWEKWDEFTFENAAKNGQIECLRYANSCGYEFTDRPFASAAESGQFECMQFLYEIGTSMTDHVFWSAAKHGNLDHLKWLRERECPWSEYACTCAAGNGHLDCLIWLHEQGCPWDSSLTVRAASEGHLECLQYAHTHGCPWHEDTCARAAEKDRIECLKYAIENNCPMRYSPYDHIYRLKPTASLRYLYEKGYRCSRNDEIERVLGIVK